LNPRISGQRTLNDIEDLKKETLDEGGGKDKEPDRRETRASTDDDGTLGRERRLRKNER